MSKIKNWKDKENINAAHGRMTRLFELIHYLMKPRSVHEVAVKLGMNDRSAYRYFYTLENLGIPVDKEIGKDGKFFIAMDTCPVCGKRDSDLIDDEVKAGDETDQESLKVTPA